MNVGCSAIPCPVILDSTCVFYSGANLIYTGINTNDCIEQALIKIDAKFRDAGLGYVFQNGITQAAPGQPVKLGGSLIEPTLISNSGFPLTVSNILNAGAHVTIGGTSSDFVKGDGSLDNTAYQPAGSYITDLTGDGTATGPGSAVFTLSNTGVLPNVYGSATKIPIITVDAKGRITWATSTTFTVPPATMIFTGDVTGTGQTNSTIPLTLNSVLATPGTFGGTTYIPVVTVNAKGLVTGISQVPFSGGGGSGTVTSVGVTAGTGISASVANPTTTPVITITNTAPDQVVTLTPTGTGLSVTGTYPNFTLQNTLPDRTVVLNNGTGISVTGTYPNFTITATGGGGSISAVTATSPLASSGGTTPNITIQQASGSQDGYLSSTDWTTFNTKEPAIAAGTTSQYWRGDKTWQTFPTIPTVIPSALTKVDDTNVTLTLGGSPSTALLAATSLTLGWTGTLADSRITSASTWNAKQNAISLTTTGTSGAATFASNVLNIPKYQSVLTNPVTGTGTATRVAFWDTGSSISSDADLYWDNVNKRLGIGTATPQYKLDVDGEINTNIGIRLGTNGAQTGIYGGANLFNFWFGNNNIATWGLAPLGGTFYDHFGSPVYNSGDSGIINIFKIRGSVTSLGTNNAGTTQLDVSPIYTQSTFGTGTLRGVYYHPQLNSLNGSTHIAWENTSGDIIHGNLAGGGTQMVTVDNTGKLGTTSIPSGGVTSVGATSPITSSGGTTPTISTSMATNKLIGRYSASTGVMEEVSIGSGLTLTGAGVLNNTATPTPLGYYLSISDSTTQTNPTADTPRAVKFDTVDLANGFSLQTETAVFTGTINNGGAGAGTILTVTGITSGTLKVGMVLTGGSITAGTFISAFTSGTGGVGTYVVSVSQLRTSATYTGTMTSQIVVANNGIYNIQFSSQLDKSDAGVDIANFWLRRNGLDVARSAGNLSLQGNSPAYMMAAWNYVIELFSGDVIELYWASPDANMSIYSEPVQTSPYPHPAVQSTILTITQQSGIMAGTGIARSVNSVSTNTAAGSGANVDYVYLVSGTTTITLPTAVGNTNRYTIKNTGTNTVSIATTSSQTIDGSSSPITINIQNVALDLISNGSNWNII